MKAKATPIIAVVALGAAFVVGLLAAHSELFANRVVDLQKSVRRHVTGFMPERPAPDRTVASTFLRLRLHTIKVPVDRSGAGGGLTSAGDALLLLTHDGAIWSVQETTPQRTRISAPDNHFAAYKAAAETGKYKHLKHALEFFRYNDILHYEDVAGRFLVVSYTEWRPELECYGTALARLPLDGPDAGPATMVAGPEEWEVFFRTNPCLPLKDTMRALEGHMAGGRIAYAGPGKVILGSGDYHWDGLYAPRSLPQGTDNDYGKVIEINVATGESQHLSIGNRNVQGVMVDRSGRVWAVEHGPRGGDELNLVQKGRNFGWPDATLGTRYNKLPWPTTAPHGRHDGFDAPVHAWLPSIGVSNLVQVERFDSTWDGDFLVGSLKAGTLFRLRETDGRIVFAEPIEIGERIRYVHQHPDGRIVLWTDDAELVFVTKSAASQSFAYIEEAIEKLELEPRRKAGISMAILACAECHSFEPNEHRDAPSLANIHGRRTAATSFRGYSPALRSLGGAWTDERIASYLTDPHRHAPGTTMPNPSLSAETITDLTSLLRVVSAPE